MVFIIRDIGKIYDIVGAHHALDERTTMKHERKPRRMPGYNYSESGHYFITICTERMSCMLGKIEDEKMNVNWCGKIVDQVLQSLQTRFPVYLDQYQIMPNHLHFILVINHAGVHHDEPKRPVLAQIIGYFKMNTTKLIRAHHDAPLHYITNKIWQRNYYDHIIRSEVSYFAIKQYIQNNPQNWLKDTYFQ